MGIGDGRGGCTTYAKSRDLDFRFLFNCLQSDTVAVLPIDWGATAAVILNHHHNLVYFSNRNKRKKRNKKE